MTKDLRKRLEEAAEKRLNCNTCLARKYGDCRENLKCQPYHSYLAGAEHGYKEAISLAKEWLYNNMHDDFTLGCWGDTRKIVCDGFEADMNKLWED